MSQDESQAYNYDYEIAREILASRSGSIFLELFEEEEKDPGQQSKPYRDFLDSLYKAYANLIRDLSVDTPNEDVVIKKILDNHKELFRG